MHNRSTILRWPVDGGAKPMFGAARRPIGATLTLRSLDNPDAGCQGASLLPERDQKRGF
jgi:hypothetical protein